MNDRVVPILIPNIAWQAYLGISSEWLGHNPSRGVDSCPSKLSDLAKYTASLAEFAAGEEIDAKRTLRKRGPWLQHTFFSFMIKTSPSIILKVAETTDLLIMSVKIEKERAAIVSGTLSHWRDAVIICCGNTSNKRLRLLFNMIKRGFDQLGLQDVFFEYKLKDVGDGTFLLENK